jgi:hypothetical protein
MAIPRTQWDKGDTIYKEENNHLETESHFSMQQVISQPRYKLHMPPYNARRKYATQYYNSSCQWWSTD